MLEELHSNQNYQYLQKNNQQKQESFEWLDCTSNSKQKILLKMR